LTNKYIDRIQQVVYKNKVRLILPEQNDPRIQKAQTRLRSMGINIVDANNYNDIDLYINHIKNKKFTNNWTDEMLEKYVSLPINKALILLNLDYADCLVAGAITTSADVIKSSIRIIGLKKKYSMDFKLFFYD